MKKKIRVSLLIFVFLFTVFNCHVYGKENDIRVIAKARWGGFIPNEGFYPPDEFIVILEIINQGKKQLVWEKCKAIFLPIGAQALILTKFHLNPDSNDGEDKAILSIIDPGKSEKISFSTNGRTDKLINDIGSEGFLFGFIFFQGDEVVVGPYFGNLPDWRILLQSERDVKKNSEKGIVLEMQRLDIMF